MAGAPGWGTDWGGLTAGPVFAAESSRGTGFHRTLWWLSSGSRWGWDNRKSDWGVRIVPAVP